MKKVLSSFFAGLSTLNVSGVLKGGIIYEPKAPHLRKEK